MISLEGLLNSIWEFIRKLFFTFWQSLFRPTKFINNLIQKKEYYILNKTYLFICVLISYYFFKVYYSPGFIDFINPGTYRKFFKEFSGFSVFEMILLATPLSLASYFIVWVLCKILRLKGIWNKLSVSLGIYTFASSRLLMAFLFPFAFFLALIIIGIFNINIEGDSSNNTTDYFKVSFVIIVLGVLSFVIFLRSFIAIYKRFYHVQRKVFYKLCILLLLIDGSYFFYYKPVKWIDGMIEDIKKAPETQGFFLGHSDDKKAEEPNPHWTGFLVIYNYHLNDEGFEIMYSQDTKGSLVIRSTLIFINNSESLTYIQPRDTLQFEIYPAALDTLAMNQLDTASKNEKMKLFLLCNEFAQPNSPGVILIEPGEKKILTFSGVVRSPASKELMKLINTNPVSSTLMIRSHRTDIKEGRFNSNDTNTLIRQPVHFEKRSN